MSVTMTFLWKFGEDTSFTMEWPRELLDVKRVVGNKSEVTSWHRAGGVDQGAWDWLWGHTGMREGDFERMQSLNPQVVRREGPREPSMVYVAVAGTFI